MAYRKRDLERIKAFAKWLRKIALEKGFESQRQLAIRSGVNEATISRVWNATQMPDEITLSKIAQALNLDVATVMREAGYDLPSRGEHSLMGNMLLDETFLTELASVKGISIDEADAAIKQVIKRNVIDSPWISERLIELIKEEMLSNDFSLEKNINTADFAFTLDGLRESKLHYVESAEKIRRMKSCIERDRSLAETLTSEEHSKLEIGQTVASDVARRALDALSRMDPERAEEITQRIESAAELFPKEKQDAPAKKMA